MSVRARVSLFLLTFVHYATVLSGTNTSARALVPHYVYIYIFTKVPYTTFAVHTAGETVCAIPVGVAHGHAGLHTPFAGVRAYHSRFGSPSIHRRFGTCPTTSNRPPVRSVLNPFIRRGRDSQGRETVYDPKELAKLHGFVWKATLKVAKRTEREE